MGKICALFLIHHTVTKSVSKGVSKFAFSWRVTVYFMHLYFSPMLLHGDFMTSPIGQTFYLLRESSTY